METTSGIQVSAIAIQGSTLYPVNLSAGNVTGPPPDRVQGGGLLVIELRNSTGETLRIDNVSRLFVFTVPRANSSVGLDRTSNLVQAGALCSYWDPATKSWKYDGLNATNVTEDGM